MSPTVPTFATLNDELNQAHRRIRELQAREAELLAENKTLSTVIAEYIHEDHRRAAAEHTSSPNICTADGVGSGDQVGGHNSERVSLPERLPGQGKPPGRSSGSGIGATAVKTKQFPYV